MRAVALAAHLAFAGVNVGAWNGFRRALGAPRCVQQRILRGYLRRNADTEFGRAHGFSSIRSVDEFRARVPARSYDEYAGWIDRISKGAPNVLTAEPVEMLEWSSGSSRAAKLIPFTRTLRREFARAVGAWVDQLFLGRPALMAGPAYWSISPAHDPPRPDGVTLPVGPMEDSDYLGGRLARLVDATMAVPGRLSRLRDPELHRRATLLYLMGAEDLRLVSVWHPSFLTLLIEAMRADWDTLVEQVASGSAFESAGLAIAARPERAARLERLGPTDLEALWPRLGLISCWTDGPARRPVQTLRGLFPGTAFQGKGLLATEGVVSIPFGDRKPLAVTSHFLEFVDEGGRALSAWELERDGTYSVLLTTGGGLYRYELHDLVRVVGFAGRTPCIEFLGKEDHVSDLAGEKLSQGFVEAVLRGLLERHRVAPDFALLAPEDDRGSPGYVLFLPLRARAPEGFAEELETRLRENPHYAHCVDLGQLRPSRVAAVPDDANERYLRHLERSGRRLGDIKPAALSASTGWARVLGASDGWGGEH